MTTETKTAQNSARSQAMSSNQPESNIASEAAAPAPGNVLRILAGLHAGASRDLAEQEMILVGSGDDCDIVLADQGVARHHALINLVGGLSSLRAPDATLRVAALAWQNDVEGKKRADRGDSG